MWIYYISWIFQNSEVGKCLNSWSGRALSYSRKALIISALALSRIWYMASLIPMSAWVDAKLPRLLLLWSSKQDLVPRLVFTTLIFVVVSTFSPSNSKCTLFWLSGFVVMLLPQMRGHPWWPFGFLTVLGLTPTPSFFLLIASGLSPFFLNTLASLVCSFTGLCHLLAWLLVLLTLLYFLLILFRVSLATSWFCSWIRKPLIALTSSVLFLATLPLIGIYLESAFLHASRPEGHRSLLVSVDIQLRSRNICFFHCTLAQSGLDWIQSLVFVLSTGSFYFCSSRTFWFQWWWVVVCSARCLLSLVTSKIFCLASKEWISFQVQEY